MLIHDLVPYKHILLKNHKNPCYYTQIHSLAKKIDVPINYLFFQDPHRILALIRNLYPNHSTVETKFTPIFEVFKAFNDHEKSLFHDYQTIYTLFREVCDIVQKSKITHMQQSLEHSRVRHIQFDTVVNDAINKHKIHWKFLGGHFDQFRISQLQTLLVVLLYRFKTIRNDYRILKFRNFTTDQDNYIDHDFTLHINIFKTMHNQDFKINQLLPKHDIPFFKKFIQIRKSLPGDFLFVKPKHSTLSHFSSSAWTQFCKHYVWNDQLTTNDLRHLRATHNNIDLPPFHVLKERGDSMQHSMLSQHSTYRFS